MEDNMQLDTVLDGSNEDAIMQDDGIMRRFNNFTLYEPQKASQRAIAARHSALFLKCDKGFDWYEVQAKFKKSTVKVAFDETGLIRAKTFDVSGLWPVDMSVAEVEQSDVTEQLMRDTGSNFMYKDGKIVLRTYTDAEIKEQERRRINQRLKEISEEMEYLQDAVDLEMATPEEEEQLKALKKERVELKRRLKELEA